MAASLPIDCQRRRACAATCRRSSSSRCWSRRRNTCSPSAGASMATARRRTSSSPQPSAAGRQDRHGLSRLWPADRGSDLRGQCRPHAGGQALRADKGFRLATYAMWWIRASIQEFILRSWSLVKMGTTASQKKLFFNLRKVKGQIQALEEGDLRARSGEGDRQAARRAEAGRRSNEPPPRRAMPRSMRRSRTTAKASGRTGWSTSTTTRRRRWPRARRSACAPIS